MLERERSILLVQQEALRDQYEKLQENMKNGERYRQEIAEIIWESGLFDEEEPGVGTSGGKSREGSGTEEVRLPAEGDAAGEVTEADGLLRGAGSCPNVMVQAVVTHKIAECGRKNIALKLDLKDMELLAADDLDLVGLFYNLFDNAIEACMRLDDSPERFIEMASGRTKDVWKLHVQNSCPRESGEENFLSTWKSDKEDHGIGHVIMQSLVRENRGKIHMEQREGRFVTDITLPVKKE
jgi:hypothetical protein